MRDGAIVLALIRQNAARVEMSQAVVGLALDGLLVLCKRRCQITALLEQISEVMPRLGMVRIQSERLPESAPGFRMPAARREEHSIVVVAIGLIRIESHRH